MSGYTTMILAGLVLGFSVAAPVGPVCAAAIREGLERGARAAFLLGLGAATVDFFYLALVYLGVAPLLLRIPWLMPLFYTMGAALVFSMAYQALRKAWEGSVPLPGLARSGPGPFVYGLGLTLLNPATIIAWLSLGGAFASAYLQNATLLQALLGVGSVFSGSLLWFAILAVAMGGARRMAGERPWIFRAVNLAAGTVLTGFGVLFVSRLLAG